MQTQTELLPPLAIQPDKVGKPLTRQEQFQHALNVANQYRSRNPRKAFQAIATNYLVIGACVAVSEYIRVFFPTCANVVTLCSYSIACLIIASRLRAFENLVHEASHYNLFVSPSSHYRFQFLYSFPVFRILQDYRASHLIHHKHLGNPSRDPDLIRIHELGLHQCDQYPIYYFLLLPFSGYIHFEYMTTTFAEFFTSRSTYPSKILYWSTALGAIYLTGTVYHFLCYYMVPFFLILPITRYWAEASEHLGMDMGSKFSHSRSNLGFGHRWYMHPHNDGYHGVHHIHSQVPFHQLPEAHKALMNENMSFRKEAVISKGIMQTFWQMVTVKTTWQRTVGEKVLIS